MTTVFWIGEQPSEIINAEPDSGQKLGKVTAVDDPNPAPDNYIPVSSRLDGTHFAAPSHNDKSVNGHRRSAPRRSVVQGITKARAFPPAKIDGSRSQRESDDLCEWERRTFPHSWQYVFGAEHPKSTLNRGAGLVSPAVRDHLGLNTDVTDSASSSLARNRGWSTLGKQHICDCDRKTGRESPGRQRAEGGAIAR